MTTLARRVRLVVTLLSVAAGAVAAQEPIPPAQDLKEAVEALREVYEKDYKAAEVDAKGKKALARKLFDAAPKRKTAAMQYASYDEVRRLAASGGEAKLALNAVTALNTKFQNTPPGLANDTLKLLSEAELAPAEAVELVSLATDATHNALERGDYAGAVTLSKLAVTAARKTEDPDALVGARRFLATTESLRTAVETIKTKPDDPTANEALGRYWVFTRARWDTGLKYLAKALNKNLAAAAQQDLAGPKSAKERTTLADAWYQLASDFKGTERLRLVDRALDWYAGAVAVAAGDDPKPTDRIKEIEKAYPILFDQKLEGHIGAATGVAITPSGRTLISVGNDYTVRLWNATTGEFVKTLDGHTNWVGSVVVTPDGTHAVTAGGSGDIRIWDLKEHREVRKLEGHRIAVRGLAITADGRTLISGGTDKTCRAWDFATGKELKQYGDRQDAIESVAVTPDGKFVLIGTSLGVITVHDAKTGDMVSQFDKHNGAVVHAIITSADGKTAFSSAREKDIRIWEIATGKELRQLKGHTDQVYQLSLSHDGKSLVSTSYDKTVRVWDHVAGRELKRFEGHKDGVQGVCFSPDGRFVYSASWDKTLRKWRVPLLPVERKVD